MALKSFPENYNTVSPQVRKLKERYGPGFLTTAEVAQQIGRSAYTVQRWRLDGVLLPSHSVQAGKVTIWLYDKATVREAVRLTRMLKPGRPRKNPVKKAGKTK